jgi:hypothetical protein
MQFDIDSAIELQVKFTAIFSSYAALQMLSLYKWIVFPINFNDLFSGTKDKHILRAIRSTLAAMASSGFDSHSCKYATRFGFTFV